MKMCFIAHSSKMGGADLVLLETIEILRTEGVECHVLLPDRGELCGELGRLGVPFSVTSYAHWMSRGRAPFFRRLRAAFNIVVKTAFVAGSILRWRCNVVYTNTATICVGALAARLLGRPHIWHLHEFGLEDQGLSFLFGERFSLALIDRLSSNCICVSEALARKYSQSIEPSKITVIYPSMHRALGTQDVCADQEAPAARRNKRFQCLIVGALMEGKGQEESVLAFAHLKRMEIDAELIILGDGIPGYRRYLEELILSHGLTHCVTLVGRFSNPFPAMRNSDAVLVCSKSEAFGRVTIEAMLAGKPVIGARSGATPELIEGGINGLLYHSGHPLDLADKIRYLVENPSTGRRLGKNAQDWSESNFTIDRYRKQILTLLPTQTRENHMTTTSHFKHLVPISLKRVLRNALDLCAEAMDYFPVRRNELLPPPRLNRSGAGDFRAVGGEFLQHFKELGGLAPDNTVLDVACGVGRMAVPLTEFLTSGSKYEGFDIMPAQVRWCRRRISARYPNFTFRIADIYNHSYNPNGRFKASEYAFVFGDRTFDFVFATSLFTHLLPDEMERYLSEIGRVMKSGARCLITFFLLTPESQRLIVEKKSILDFAYRGQGYLTIDEDAPERAVAYDEAHVRSLFEKYGLKITSPVNYGYWCGRKEFLSYQDIIVAEKQS